MVGVSKAESTEGANCQVLCLFEAAPFPIILGVYSGVSKSESTADLNGQLLCLFEAAPSILGVKSMFQKHTG